MIQIMFFSGLLILGMILSQLVDFSGSSSKFWIGTLTMVCLAYIMIEVGLEFTVDKKRLRSYSTDYFVSASAATLPWLFALPILLSFLVRIGRNHCL